MEQENDSEESSLFARTFEKSSEPPPSASDGGQPSAEAPEPAPTEMGEAAPEPDEGQPRDEAGRFAPKAKDAETAAPPAAEREPQNVPVAALKDERAKRQALEAEVAQYRAREAQWQRQQQAQPAPQPPADKPDPMGALLDNPHGFVEERAVQVARQMVAPLEDQMFRDRLNFSVARAKQAPDFEEVDALVSAAIAAAPPEQQQRLAETLRRHPDPGQWVLTTGRAIKERQAFEAWKASQQQAPSPQPETPPPSTPALPASLATARGVGASRQPDSSAPESLFQRIWRS